jgi:hypothetical protein
VGKPDKLSERPVEVIDKLPGDPMPCPHFRLRSSRRTLRAQETPC